MKGDWLNPLRKTSQKLRCSPRTCSIPPNPRLWKRNIKLRPHQSGGLATGLVIANTENRERRKIREKKCPFAYLADLAVLRVFLGEDLGFRYPLDTRELFRLTAFRFSS